MTGRTPDEELLTRVFGPFPFSPLAEGHDAQQDPASGDQSDGGGSQRTSDYPSEEAAPVPPASGAPTAAVSHSSPSGFIGALAGRVLKRLVPLVWRL